MIEARRGKYGWSAIVLVQLSLSTLVSQLLPSMSAKFEAGTMLTHHST